MAAQAPTAIRALFRGRTLRRSVQDMHGWRAPFDPVPDHVSDCHPVKGAAVKLVTGHHMPEIIAFKPNCIAFLGINGKASTVEFNVIMS